MSKSRTAEATLRVFPPDTAEAMRLSPEDSFPAVIASSRLAELIELEAIRALEPELRDGQMSVGLATRMQGTEPVSQAVFRWTRRSRGNIHHFQVEIFDGACPVATAEHTRAVVAARRIAGLARRRAGLPSMQLNV